MNSITRTIFELEKIAPMRSKIRARLKSLLLTENFIINLPNSNKTKPNLTNIFIVFMILIPSLSAILLMALSDWALFRNSGIKASDFKDYQTILSYKACLKEINLLELPPYFSECWAGFNYGFSAILLVGALNYIFGSIAAVGWTTIFLVVITLVGTSLFCGSRDLVGRTFQSIIIISPGILLLYERGNLDSWIFIFSIILVMGYKHINPLLLFVCLFLLTLIKFHILFASLYLISIIPISRKYKVFMTISISLATGISLAPMAGLIPYNWFLSFGSVMPLVYLDFGLTSVNFESLALGIRICLGAALFICLTLLARWASPSFRRLTTLEIDPKCNESVMLNFFSICYLSSFFLSTNYDYRLVFLLPALIVFDRELFTRRAASRERKFFITITISSLYIGSIYSAPFFYLQAAQLIGDLGLSLVSALLLLRLFSSLKGSRSQR
jgi:hypothetical protein